GTAMILTAAALLLGEGDAAKKDLEKFQGTWVLVSLEAEGAKMPEDRLKDRKLVLKGSAYSWTSGAKGEAGTFTLDPTKRPKAINSTPTDGTNKGKTRKGIYAIEGETLKFCFAVSGQER